MCEGLSKISSNFALHLIKVGKLRRFKKVSSDLKTIFMTDLIADLRSVLQFFEGGGGAGGKGLKKDSSEEGTKTLVMHCN